MKSLVCTTCGHRQFNFPIPHLIECQACGNQYSTEKNFSKKKPQGIDRLYSENTVIGYEAGYAISTGNICLGSSVGSTAYFGKVEQISMGG